jgi:hypothetical protein
MKNHLRLFCAIQLALLSAISTAVAAPAPGIHIRGTITSLTGSTLTVQTSSATEQVQLPANLRVATVIPSDRSHIRPGVFVGIASISEPEGSQKAAEVVVFPNTMRGAGEGSYPWDLPGPKTMHSKMTNGTVAPPASASRSRMTNGTVRSEGNGMMLTIAYSSSGKSGAQAITVPNTIPIVTFLPGTLSELVPGAHVFVIAKPVPGNIPIAMRVLVGKNGLVPPM